MGSLSPTFVPARPVRLAVKLPSAFALLRVMSIHPEGTFGRLRYSLGGDRPSQTTRLVLSTRQIMAGCETQNNMRVVFHFCLPNPHKSWINGSHLSYAHPASYPGQGVVKLHGVFLSCRG